MQTYFFTLKDLLRLSGQPRVGGDLDVGKSQLVGADPWT